MPRLLVSVRDAAEAEMALAGGADLIDVKEPANGALGRADSAVIQAVVRTVNGRALVSAAGGELESSPEPLPAGLAFAKFGLRDWAGRDWVHVWARIRRQLPRGCKPVAVAYADWPCCGAPPPDEVSTAAVDHRFGAFLIDTFEKNGAKLLDRMPLTTIAELTRRCQLAGVPVALAGSLGVAEIERLRPARPNWFAVRGAACRHGRGGTIDKEKVRELTRLIAGSAPLADSGRGEATT
jgi:(5-formylfuran-3-yl)methyl phosphate synthase